MRYFIIISAILLSSFISNLYARNNDIEELAEEVFGSSSYGILAVRNSGDTIVNIGSRHKLVPASNAKLITTGLALINFGTDYKFRTEITYTGKINNGTLDGDVYIVGGGDPTIGSEDSIAIPTKDLFAKWKAFIDEAGIKKINGDIIGDGRYFEGDIEEPSWEYEDLGTYYGTGGNGLCFYRNIIDFKVIPGIKIGTPLKITNIYPDTPWMKYNYSCTTGEKGTGERLYLYTNDFSTDAEIRGTFALDRKYHIVKFSNKFGAYTCAFYFSNYLNDNGIDVIGGAADVDKSGMVRYLYEGKMSLKQAAESDKLKVLGYTESPSVERILYIINHRSDNFYAETFFRQLGKKYAGSANYLYCSKTIDDLLNKMGLNTEGVKLQDGSGLSRKNYVSPQFFCSFLKAMMNTEKFEKYLNTLNNPGIGLKNETEEVRRRVFSKSGSMGGVRCYSGYISPSEGGKEDTIIFSIMVNNCTLPNWKIKSTLDKIIASLAKEN